MFNRLVLVFTVTFLGCNAGSGTEGAPAQLTMTGTVVDSGGRAAPGIDVRVTPFDGEETTGPPVVARTALDGTFLAEVARGNHELRIESGGVLVFQSLVALDPEGDIADLGILRLTQEVDSDGDGLADGIETDGWEILVNVLGIERRETRHVTSDPTVADTDGDGLNDAEEFASRTDARTVDTDGDLLDDWTELHRYKSKPNHVDSDGDACVAGCLIPDPNLFDGNELRLSGTSPTLDDTDGDGILDGVEIAGGGFSALVADLPEVTLELFGDPSVAVNATVEQAEAAEFMNATLERNQDTQSETDTNSTQNVIEVSEGWNAGGGTTIARPPSLTANGGFSRQERETFTNEVSSSFTQQSVQETREEFVRRTSSATNVTFTTGTLQAAFRVRNTSRRSFRITNLSVVAFRLLPGSRGGFSVIGHLFPETAFPAGVILGPGGEFIFVARNADLPAQNVLPLLENPSALFFEISNYTIEEVDDTGAVVRDIAAIGQRIIERTAEIVMDLGDGRVERFSVATNVTRNEDGSTTGITVGAALEDILGIARTTTPGGNTFVTEQRLDDDGNPVFDGNGNPVMVLTALRDAVAFAETDPATGLTRFGVWAVIGNGPQYEPEALVSFENLVLKNGDRVTLVYVRDDDGDGLLDREEYHYGTSPFAADTDEDGLDDRAEIKDGWVVRHFEAGVELPQFQRRVFPDPRFADFDGDGLTDLEERDGLCATDPARIDTDGDGVLDDIDPAPCDRPGTSAPVPTLGLLAYYPFNGDADDEDGLLPLVDGEFGGAGLLGTRWPTGDNTLPFGNNQPGGGVHLDADRFGALDAAFRLEVFDDQQGGRMEGFLRFPNLAAGTDFTLALWVRVARTNTTTNTRPITLIGQQGFAALQIDPMENDHDILFDVRTGPTDGSPTILTSRVVAEDIDDEWTFIAGRVAYDEENNRSTVTLFIRSFDNAFTPVTASTVTARRFANPSSSGAWYLGVAVPPEGSVPESNAVGDDFFRGNVDDVRVYDRALSDFEIDLLSGERGS